MGRGRSSWLTASMSSTRTSTSTSIPSAAPTIRLADAAANTPADRNRAVDLYRAVAMVVVALGHWAGMVAVMDDGELTGGNLLDFAPEYGWITWIGQVMPLFFFVGGYASAVSLLAAERKGVRAVDWVATRLRRMMAPAVVLAGVWAAVIVVGSAFGAFGIVTLAAGGAAIPLWFLANYTIDTTIAPLTFRWFRERPATLIGGLSALFLVAEAANLAGIPVLPQLNWVIGWLGFQIAGFAWQQGRLPTGRRLVACAGALWVVAVVATTVGPWPAVMLHHGGVDPSPTHPPSTALVLFGFAYSLTAAALAPAANRWLTRSHRAWRLTVGANVVAMSVYLWHMTAAMVVAGVAYALGALPSVPAGTGAWWITKVPFVLANAAVLAAIVWKVAPIERRALLGGTVVWPRSAASLAVTAAILSLGVKAWSNQDPSMLCVGLATTLIVWFVALRRESVRAAGAPSGMLRPWPRPTSTTGSRSTPKRSGRSSGSRRSSSGPSTSSPSSPTGSPRSSSGSAPAGSRFR